MAVQNAEIITAAKLIFGDEDFEPLTPEDISTINAHDPQDESTILSGSVRRVEAYHPEQGVSSKRCRDFWYQPR